jgi:hypothetical protein
MARRTHIRTLMMMTAIAALVSRPQLADAGCGCSKPPPPPAAVRPSVAYAGAPVTLFSPLFKAGQRYTVTFASGTSKVTQDADGVAVTKRDLTDGVTKVQLVVPLPDSLPLGPTRISITGPTAGGVIPSIPDSAFTVAPTPIAIPAAYGQYQWPKFRAAVGRDGVAYIALDLTAVTKPMVFEAQALGYPLRFTNQDVTFYNIQGFLMQQLVTNGVDPIPGMFVFPAANPTTDSDTLHYSRHEFTTYFLQHAERLPHAVDPTDPNWHLDGSRHVDHNHLILAIKGRMNDGTLPTPGATPMFTLAAKFYSLFYKGLTGASSVTLRGFSWTNSYTPGTSLYGKAGDVFTNGRLSVLDYARLDGSATAASISVSRMARISGDKTCESTPTTFMPVIVPPALPDLGVIDLDNLDRRTIVGPGSFLVTSLNLKDGSTLFVDNSAGPVTLYVSGSIQATERSEVILSDTDPEKFAMYVTGNQPVTIAEGSLFSGVVYAPSSPLSLSGRGVFFGAFVGNTVDVSGLAIVHYDSLLRGSY